MDAKIGVIFGCVLAVVLLILSAMNMGNIGSVQRDVRRAAKGQEGLVEENSKLTDRVGQLEDDLSDARKKIAKLETKSVGVEGAAEVAARRAAKNYLDTQRDEIISAAVEKAVRRIDLGSINRDVAALRASLAKMRAGGPRGKGAGDAGTDRLARGIEDGMKELAKRAGEDAGVDVTEDQQKKTADAIGKSIGGFMDLMRQRRNGEITEEEFREQARQLRERTREAVEGNFTPEQIQQMRERFGNRRRRDGNDGDGDAGGGGDDANF